MTRCRAAGVKVREGWGGYCCAQPVPDPDGGREGWLPAEAQEWDG